MLLALVAAFCLVSFAAAAAMPNSGIGTATVYSTSSYEHGVGACNCKKGIAKYPTAALSQYYFGAASGQGSGPACGKCFRLTVVGDPYSTRCPSSKASVVVKVADLCPAVYPNLDWCAANANTNNKFGVKAHFDLDQANVQQLVSQTGLKAFYVHYCEVDCSQWAGYKDNGANERQSTTWGSCPRSPAKPSSTTCVPIPNCYSSSPLPEKELNNNNNYNNNNNNNNYDNGYNNNNNNNNNNNVIPANRPQLVWNGNSNEWWFAVTVIPRPNSVAVNCGAGWRSLGNPTWDRNAWESNNHCVGSFQIKIDGNVYPARLFDSSQMTLDVEEEQPQQEQEQEESSDNSNEDVDLDGALDEDTDDLFGKLFV